jgi:hypothetical protein
LAFDDVGQVAEQLVHWNQGAVHAAPNDFAVLVDQEVVPFSELADIVVRAELLDDDCVDVTEKCILGIDLFLEDALRRPQVAGNRDDFDIQGIELALVCTELGVFACSATGEGSRKECEQDFLFAGKILETKRCGALSRRQFEVRSFFSHLR